MCEQGAVARKTTRTTCAPAATHHRSATQGAGSTRSCKVLEITHGRELVQEVSAECSLGSLEGDIGAGCENTSDDRARRKELHAEARRREYDICEDIIVTENMRGVHGASEWVEYVKVR